MSTYKPGTCNIGAREKRVRVMLGVVFAVLSVGFFVFFGGSKYAPWIFAPLFVSALGFVQARQNFCVAYGLAGKYSMNEFGNAKKVANAGAHDKDVNHSIVLIFASAVIAAGLTLVALAF